MNELVVLTYNGMAAVNKFFPLLLTVERSRLCIFAA